MEVEISVGSTVIWVDEDLNQHNAKVTKIKRDMQLDLELIDTDPKVIITNGAHKSVQHPDYGCYWTIPNEVT